MSGVMIVLGITRTAFALGSPLPYRGLAVLNVVLTLVLGLLIAARWPSSSVWTIGIFVGVDVIAAGAAFMATGIAARKLGPGVV
jgi:uncharacterized membrane protein HdeD (DUF308 family)